MEQPSLLEVTNRMLVCAPPIVVEGLRSIGCDVVASTGFAAQLASLAVRIGPDAVIVHGDPRAFRPLQHALERLRERTRLTRVVVLAPGSWSSHEHAVLAALDCEAVAQESEPAALRALLGVEISPPLVPLTAREVQVLQLAAQGLTKRAIGVRLGLRENTVKNYLRHVHEKLDVHSRTEAVMAAAAMGYPVLPLR